jgi:hypothetical protein
MQNIRLVGTFSQTQDKHAKQNMPLMVRHSLSQPFSMMLAQDVTLAQELLNTKNSENIEPEQFL